jgi:hypothetical protein
MQGIQEFVSPFFGARDLVKAVYVVALDVVSRVGNVLREALEQVVRPVRL